MDNTQLLQRIEKLERIINEMAKPDRYLFERDIEMVNGKNFKFNTITGTKLGTSATQKIGFFGTAPIAQQVRPVTTADIINLIVAFGLSA